MTSLLEMARGPLTSGREVVRVEPTTRTARWGSALPADWRRPERRASNVPPPLPSARRLGSVRSGSRKPLTVRALLRASRRGLPELCRRTLRLGEGPVRLDDPPHVSLAPVHLGAVPPTGHLVTSLGDVVE